MLRLRLIETSASQQWWSVKLTLCRPTQCLDCEPVYAGAEINRLTLADDERLLPFCQVLQAQELRAAVTLSKCLSAGGSHFWR